MSNGSVNEVKVNGASWRLQDAGSGEGDCAKQADRRLQGTAAGGDDDMADVGLQGAAVRDGNNGPGGRLRGAADSGGESVVGGGDDRRQQGTAARDGNDIQGDAAGGDDDREGGRLQSVSGDGEDARLQGARSGGGECTSGVDWRLQGSVAGDGDGSDMTVVEINTASGCDGGESVVPAGIPSVASGDDDKNRTGRGLSFAAPGSSDSVQNGYVALLCGTAFTGGADGEGSELPAAADGAVATCPSASKRKRGRPKGSKNKPKATDGAEPKRKRGRPAGSKAPQIRSLTQAMGHAQADARTETQSRPESMERRPQQDPAAASAAVNESDDDGPVLPGTIEGSARRTSPARSPLIPALYVDTLVAFSPEKEGWTKRQKTNEKFVGVGSSYLVGRVCRIVKGALFHVQWLDSQYQNKDEHLNLSMIQRGNANYRSLYGNSARVGWSHRCAADEGDGTQIEGDIDDMEECMEVFNPQTELPTSLSEVEAIRSMRFEPGAQSDEPGDLYRHTDGTTTTRLRPQFKHLFEHSASASFFTYIPLSFWQQVVGETNSYARVHGIALGQHFTLDEVMKFLGVLFYMELVDKGEYSNYWGQQVEDTIFGGGSVSLDAAMPLRRFKQLRQAFCFRCIEASGANSDQAHESGHCSIFSR